MVIAIAREGAATPLSRDSPDGLLLSAPSLFSFATGGLLGVLYGGFPLLLIGIVTGGTIAITVQSTRRGDFFLAVISLYTLAAFGIRPLAIYANPDYIHSNTGLSVTDLRLAIVHAEGIVLAGFIALVVGWQLGQGRRSSPHLPHSPSAPMSARGLVVMGAVLMVSSFLLLQKAGGINNAISSAKTIRTQLAGSFFLLFGVWVAQAGALLVIANNFTHRQPKISVRLSWTILLFGGAVGLAVGSRGAAAPALVGALVLYFVHGETKARLRAAGTAVVLVAILTGYGAYKEYTAPGQQSAVSSETLLAQVSEADYFALAVVNRGALPSGTKLAASAAQAPLFLLPSALYSHKPTPYDFYVRDTVIGGVVTTGLPISLYGEGWLIAGYAGTISILFGLGFLSRRVSRAFNDRGPVGKAYNAMFVGCAYLIASRPIVLSVSRLLTLLLAVWVAGCIMRTAARSSS